MKKPLLVLAFLIPMVDGSGVFAAPFVFVSRPDAGVVTVIDQGTTGVPGAVQLAGTIQVGGQPTGLALNESGSTLYVANAAAHRVDFIDTTTYLTTASVPTLGAPSLLTYDPSSRKLYVKTSTMTYGDYPIVVIDTARQAIVATIPYQSFIAAFQLDRARGVVYVLDQISSAILVISTSTNQIVGTLANRSDLLASGFGLDATGSRLYIADWAQRSGFDIPPGSDIVTVIDIDHNSVVASIDVQDDPTTIVADSGRPLVYVGAFTHMVAIDTQTNTVAWTIATPQGAGPIALSDDDSLLFFGSSESDVITVIDIAAQKIVASIPIDGAFAMAAPAPVPNIVAQADNGQCVPAFGMGPSNYGSPTTPQPATVIQKGNRSVRICMLDSLIVDHITVVQTDNRLKVTVYDSGTSFGPNPISIQAVDVGPLLPGHYVVDAIVDAAFLDVTSRYPYPIATSVPFDIATPTAAPDNYQGLWFNPAEAGWGVNFAHQGDLIFASWFTYDLSGKGTWLVMTAAKTAATTYSGQLLQGTGPAFDAAPFPPLGSAGGATIGGLDGTGTVTFTDANNATFTYTLAGITQSKNITRELFGPQPTCTFGTQADLALATNYTDLWWASPPGSEAGWGINLTHQGDVIFATWFTFDHDHSPMWLVVQANRTMPNTYVGNQIFRLTGPPFNTVPFPALGSPGGPQGSSVGNATFSLGDGNRLYFSYTVDGVSQSKEITREVFVAPGTVCQ